MRGVRSDHEIFDLQPLKDGLFDCSETLQQFLNGISEHFLFWGDPLGPPNPRFAST